MVTLHVCVCVEQSTLVDKFACPYAFTTQYGDCNMGGPVLYPFQVNPFLINEENMVAEIIPVLAS